MPTFTKTRIRWWPLLVTNFLGVLNDNFLKTLACFVAVYWAGLRHESLLVTTAAGALVLPYIFLSPLAGRWAETYSKLQVVRRAKAAELCIMALASLAFYKEWAWLVILCIFLMGLQSCMFSPSKYGLIRDVGGYGRINEGTGYMEMSCFVGMLTGTLLASFVASWSAFHLSLMFLGWSLLGLGASYCIQAKESPTVIGSQTLRPFKFLWQSYRQAKSFRDLNPLIIGLCVFWLISAMLQMQLIVYCRRHIGMTDIQTGLTLSAVAVAVGAGCALAGRISRKCWRYRLVLPAGLCAAVLLLWIYLYSPTGWTFALLISMAAFFFGLFKVPLDASIPAKTPGRTLGIMLAYSNQLSFIFILLASGCFGLLSAGPGLHGVFLFCAALTLLTLIYLGIFSRDLLKLVWRRCLHLGYNITLHGTEVLPSQGAFLLLPNHISLTDPQIIVTELYRYPIAPIVTARFWDNRLFEIILNKLEAIPVPDLEVIKTREAVKAVREIPRQSLRTLQNGTPLLLYPAGALSDGPVEKVRGKQLAWEIVRDLPQGIPVIRVRTEGMWGSNWSRAHTGKTPSFAGAFRLSLYRLLRHGLFFLPRRRIHIYFADATVSLKAAAQKSREAFLNELN